MLVLQVRAAEMSPSSSLAVPVKVTLSPQVSRGSLGGTVMVTQTRIEDQRRTGHVTQGGDVAVRNSQFLRNGRGDSIISYESGAITLNCCTMLIENSLISDNYGGIYVRREAALDWRP